MQSDAIGRREHEILTAIVESYIATGDPVGSRTLVAPQQRRFERGHDSQRHVGSVRCWIS